MCDPSATVSKWGGFAVLRADGHYWDGQGWTIKTHGAWLFTGPPDAYADCEAAVLRLRRLGHRCNVAYLPPRYIGPAAQVP